MEKYQQPWITRINILITTLPNIIYRSNDIPNKIFTIFFTEVGGENPKIHVEPDMTPNSQRNPEQKKKLLEKQHFQTSR